MNTWKHEKLGNVCSIKIGGTPHRNNLLFWDTEKASGNLWVSIKDLGQRVISETKEQITDLGIRHSNAKLIEQGSLLLSFKLTIGKVAFAGRDLYTNEAIAALVPHSITPEYMYYGLQFWNLLAEVDQAIKGATLNKEKLANIAIFFPESQAEQTAIADILATVDRAIEQTEALIAKQRRIKAGLLHDLLTRGIDEHGHLRDPSTHRFKPSPVGLVPEEWEVVPLGNVVDHHGGVIQTGPFGSQLHAEEYTAEGVPFVMPQDIAPDGRLLLDTAARIPEHRAHDLRRHFLKDNDVLFARRGDLSRCAAIHQSDIAITGSGCMLVRLPRSAMFGEWLVHVYKHERCQRQIMARAVGSTMVNLNSTLLRDLMIALPKQTEQERSLRLLDRVQDLAFAVQQELDKLGSLKTGLMQDLLSGRVSVAGLVAALREAKEGEARLG